MPASLSQNSKANKQDFYTLPKELEEKLAALFESDKKESEKNESKDLEQDLDKDKEQSFSLAKAKNNIDDLIQKLDKPQNNNKVSDTKSFFDKKQDSNNKKNTQDKESKKLEPSDLDSDSHSGIKGVLVFILFLIFISLGIFIGAYLTLDKNNTTKNKTVVQEENTKKNVQQETKQVKLFVSGQVIVSTDLKNWETKANTTLQVQEGTSLYVKSLSDGSTVIYNDNKIYLDSSSTLALNASHFYPSETVLQGHILDDKNFKNFLSFLGVSDSYASELDSDYLVSSNSASLSAEQRNQIENKNTMKLHLTLQTGKLLAQVKDIKNLSISVNDLVIDPDLKNKDSTAVFFASEDKIVAFNTDLKVYDKKGNKLEVNNMSSFSIKEQNIEKIKKQDIEKDKFLSKNIQKTEISDVIDEIEENLPEIKVLSMSVRDNSCFLKVKLSDDTGLYKFFIDSNEAKVYPNSNKDEFVKTETKEYKVDCDKEITLKLEDVFGNFSQQTIKPNEWQNKNKNESLNADSSDKYLRLVNVYSKKPRQFVAVWDIKGLSAPNGFKVVYSKDHNPTYPGSNYKYMPNEGKAQVTVYKVEPGTYYVRVCIYDGQGGCSVYSNEMSVTVSE